MPSRTTAAGLLLIAAAACAAAADTSQERLTRWLDRIAQQQLQERSRQIAAVRNTADAARRQAWVRAKLLELNGGLPGYNGPLNAQTTGKIEHPGYVIEKLRFESSPGLYVTANLYRPAAPGKYPGVLLPLGHWEQGKVHMQRIAANLALKGFVALAYDPLGQGERQQIYDRRLGASLAGASVPQHIVAGGQSLLTGTSFARYRIHDGRRAIDYLVSRPEVDAERIGVTGCSGGGTLTTYIAALDPRVKVAAPACYMNSFQVLFAGSVGDSEQSLPGFLSSGLDQADYVELFAPKPWLMSSTEQDFFTPAGAKIVYEEARRWYELFGAGEKIKWVVGKGEHGTPLEVREAIYEWMIRWLKDGHGDPAEQPVEMHSPFELEVTPDRQVALLPGSRDIGDIIRADYEKRKNPGTEQQMMAALREWSPAPPSQPPAVRRGNATSSAGVDQEEIWIETDPGFEVRGVVLTAAGQGRRPGVVVVEASRAPSAAALELARGGAVVLALEPRGKPVEEENSFIGDWLSNTRALLVGRNLPGMRAFDIRRALDVLAARPDVDAARLRGAARGPAGVWLLMAAALDSRLGALWLDHTPYSLRVALENPLSRNLHDAALPGFVLHWDLEDLMRAIGPGRVLWSDPTDWVGVVTPLGNPYLYRAVDEQDDRFMRELLR